MEGATSTAPVKEIDNQDHQDLIDHLPPGFRFHPTDEEITSHYLTHKVMNASFSARAIGEVDLNKFEPWDLPKKAKMGGKELYFFWKRDKKYPTGTRTNRATDSGYWKATGKDKEIIIKDNKEQKGHLGVVGMKKTLVFYKGRAPKGDKTNWVMHEFRLESKFSYNFNKNEWVVCRVVHKNTGVRRSPSSPITTTGGHENMITRMNSINTSLFKDDDILLLGCPNNNSMPPLMNVDPPNHYSEYYKDRPGGSRFSDIEEEESESKRARARATDTVGNDEYLRYFSTTMNDQQRLQKKFNLYPDHHPYYHHGMHIHHPTENRPIFPFQAYHDHYLHQQQQQQQQRNNTTTTTTSNSCTSSLVPSFLGRAQPDTAVSCNIKNGKLHDNPDEERQSYYCKLEHYLPSCYQSSSMVTSLSQDTTLDVATPTTTTTEISSSLVHVSTKQENNVGIYSKLSYEEEEEEADILGGAFVPVLDLDILWN